MSYQIVENNGSYGIVEEDNEVVIQLSLPKKKVNDLCRKLNLGAGFNGSTPHFFAKDIWNAKT